MRLSEKRRKYRGIKMKTTNSQIACFVYEQMQLRDCFLQRLSQIAGNTVSSSILQINAGQPSESLKQAICAELGFQSWEQLTKAALADNNELLEV